MEIERVFSVRNIPGRKFSSKMMCIEAHIYVTELQNTFVSVFFCVFNYLHLICLLFTTTVYNYMCISYDPMMSFSVTAFPIYEWIDSYEDVNENFGVCSWQRKKKHRKKCLLWSTDIIHSPECLPTCHLRVLRLFPQWHIFPLQSVLKDVKHDFTWIYFFNTA